MASIPHILILRRKINELECTSFAGYDVASSGLSLSEHMIHTLQHNPFLEDDSEVAQLVGVYKGEIAGGEVVFPLAVSDRGKEYACLSGAALWVDETKRKSNLGMLLPEEMCNASSCKIAVAGGTSQKALPVYQFLGYECFLMPRNIMLWRSRALVETKFKGFVAKCVTFALDCGIWLYSLLLKIVCSCKLNGLTVEEVSSDNESTLDVVAGLISEDSAPFAEVHDARWLKWHMTESFSKDGPIRLFVARAKGEVIGFYMTKKRFHKQASHRGFKNVWLGSVVEWQVKKGYEKKLGWLLVSAALRLKKEGVDAVEIPSADLSLNRFLRSIGWRQVGESNFVIKAGEGSPLFGNEEMTKIENWRLRPVMGDAGLS